MNIGLAAGPCQHLTLNRERMEKIVNPLRRRIRIQPFAQLRVLRCNTYRAPTRMAVITVAGLYAHFPWKVRFGNGLVTVQRHEHGVPDRHRISTQRHSLRNITTVSNTTGVNQRNLTRLTHIIKRLSSLPNSRNAWHTGLFCRQVRASASPAFHAVDIDGVRSCLRRHANVVINPCRAQF